MVYTPVKVDKETAKGYCGSGTWNIYCFCIDDGNGNILPIFRNIINKNIFIQKSNFDFDWNPIKIPINEKYFLKLEYEYSKIDPSYKSMIPF